jgi:hypothetical protein
MSTYNGHCHCKQTEWTAELTDEQQGHILWYVCIPYLQDSLPLSPISLSLFHLLVLWWGSKLM